MSGVLVVFAKHPVPGRVKTRMCPPFTPEQAADFYRCLLTDVLAETARVAPGLGLSPALCVTPPEACDELAAMAPAGFRVSAQQGARLGVRMERAVEEAAGVGFSPILLRGSDSPTLAAPTLGEALRALSGSDVVLCPDRDGGYNLVGLRAPARGLFDHPMSTASVLEDTQRNARALGLRAALLEPGFDIDTADDLRWLQQARAQGRADVCPRTLSFLDRHALWPKAE